jgi:hypothetical protein
VIFGKSGVERSALASTAEQVRAKAQAAANVVKPNDNAVFVTQAGVRRWHGLKEVRRVRRA